MSTTISEIANKSKGEIKLLHMYIKNSLFEAASLTRALLENPSPPALDIQVFANHFAQDKEMHEAVLTLQVTAKQNASLLWRVQLQKAGLYTLQGFTEEQQKHVLSGFCMDQLYPHAAAAVTQLVSQCGFQTIYLQPMSFEQLYKEQQLQNQKTEAATV